MKLESTEKLGSADIDHSCEKPHRKRCASTTREAILEAGMRHFTMCGFERSGVREIAADAGVTAALVNRYFGSKDGLFAAVIERAFDQKELLSGDVADLAERLSRHFVLLKEERMGQHCTPLLLLLRCATEPRSADLLRANLERNFIAPLAAMLEGPDAEHRAAMVAALLTGFATLDQTIQANVFDKSDRTRLMRQLCDYLRIWIDG
jgi:AcrR family transcriptional regulator